MWITIASQKFIKLLETDKESLQQELVNNWFEHMEKEYWVSRSMLRTYLWNKKKDKHFPLYTVKKMRREWISDKNIWIALWIDPTNIWKKLWPRSWMSNEVKRRNKWQVYIAERKLNDFRWEYKEETPYWDIKNAFYIWQRPYFITR